VFTSLNREYIIVKLRHTFTGSMKTFIAHARVPAAVSAPVIKCKKTPKKKCSFVAKEAKKR